MDATCSCPRGIKCHHIATLVLFGHHNISVTDKECLWNMPGPSSKKVEIKTAEELFPSRNQYSAIDRSMSEVEIEDLRSKLNMYGNTVGFT